jgi:hypothetical protein
MFTTVLSEIGDRTLSLEIYFKSTCRPGFSKIALLAKGLAFVQMYAIYEYSIVTSVREALLEIKGAGLPIGQLRLELVAFVLNDDWKAIRDCGVTKTWKRRLGLLSRVNCGNPVDAPDDTFPTDGSHFREQQLETIWSLFGINSSIVPHGRYLPLISELVANRNAIAHGREKAEDIGRRYSPAEILKKIEMCRDLCVHVATTLETHCRTPANLTR